MTSDRDPSAALSAEERALLARLFEGTTRLRRFPSRQWSVAGKQFIRSNGPERLEKLGLIEQGPVGKKGVVIYVTTERAKDLAASNGLAVSRAHIGAARKAMRRQAAAPDASRLAAAIVGFDNLTG